MIMEPEKRQDTPPEQRPDKLTGTFLRTALVVAAVEFLVYWLLVIRFPVVMAPLSVVLGAASWFFMRPGNYLDTVREEMQLSPRDMHLLMRYCKSWIYIAAYGTAFALFLLWRG